MTDFFSNSKIFLYFCLNFTFGVLVASFFKIPILALFVVVIIAVIFSSVFWRDKRKVVAGFCLIFLVLGVWRFQLTTEEKSYVSQFNNFKEKIVLKGVVIEEPDVRIGDTQYIIKVESFVRQSVNQGEINFDKENNLGKILVIAAHYPAYQYGDLIELEGKLKAPVEFEFFDYKNYLAKDGIFSIMYHPSIGFISSDKGNLIYATIFKIKNKFKDKLNLILPEPENSLLKGILLGERSGMSEKLKNDFAITGTSHIVAVSGFNVTIIGIIILELALIFGFSRSQSFWISLSAIILFIIMVGAPASAIRAGIMSGLILIAVRVGRLHSTANAITFAAVLMLALNPKIIRFDAGFQLSFLAVAGIVWLYPILNNYFSNKNKKNSKERISFVIIFLEEIKNAFLMTISAQIMALPILLGSFGNLSLVAPLANILILPFVPIAMGFGFLAGVVSFIWVIPAKIIGYFTWLFLTYQIRVIEYLADLPWASVKIWNFGFSLFAVYYIIIVMILIREWKKSRRHEF